MGLGNSVQAILASLPDWVGTLPAWISASTLLGIFGVLVRRELGLKKIEVEADQVNVSARKIETDEAANIREHWAGEVQRLQDALAAQDGRHNDALTAMEARHAKEMKNNADRQERCEQERERLALRVTEIEQELKGVMAQVRMAGAEQMVLLAASGQELPPHAVEAARRIVARHGG